MSATEAQIRSAAAAAIGTKTGAAAIDALITAGLLPLVEEEQWVQTSVNPNLAMNKRQTRYVTAWEDAT